MGTVCFKRAKGKLVGDGNTIQVRNIYFQVRAAEVTWTPIKRMGLGGISYDDIFKR